MSLLVPGQLYTMWTSPEGSVVSGWCPAVLCRYTLALPAFTTITFPSGPELLSDDSVAVSSPRLSPDQCRIVYLQYPSLVPHHQCSQLCLVSWGEGSTEGEGGQMRDKGRVRCVFPWAP